MSATIRDIKKATGLSLATISKYLNGGHVLDENKERIERAIEELDYEVNELARGLVTRKTNVIGVLVYDISCVYVSNMLRHIGLELRKRGYGMMICDSGSSAENERENLLFLLHKKVAGLIVFPISQESSFLEPAKRADIPVVLVDRAIRDADCDCIEIDNRDASYKITSAVLERGHTRLAFIGSDVEYTGMERGKGFREAVGDAGIATLPEYLIYGMHSYKLGYNGMMQLLGMQERPTAVFLANYETMLGAMTALNEAGVNYPEEISVVGFDDMVVSQVVRPKPWLVSQPMSEMCSEAVRLLFDRIAGSSVGSPKRVIFASTIVEGASVRDLREANAAK